MLRSVDGLEVKVSRLRSCISQESSASTPDLSWFPGWWFERNWVVSSCQWCLEYAGRVPWCIQLQNPCCTKCINLHQKYSGETQSLGALLQLGTHGSPQAWPAKNLSVLVGGRGGGVPYFPIIKAILVHWGKLEDLKKKDDNGYYFLPQKSKCST